MTRKDTVADEKVAGMISQPHAISDIDLDEEIELKKQRARVARFLGLRENSVRAKPTGGGK